MMQTYINPQKPKGALYQGTRNAADLGHSFDYELRRFLRDHRVLMPFVRCAELRLEHGQSSLGRSSKFFNLGE